MVKQYIILYWRANSN